MPLEGRYEIADGVPRRLGELAAAGELLAAPLALADFFRLEDRFERLGHFGIAVRGRAHSALLFARRPIRQLDGASIAVTEDSSTTARLLRLILEERYHLSPARYTRGRDPEADAVLLIGNEALRTRQANTSYPFETDLGLEWWLWQHLPFTFAVWAIRKDAPAGVKRDIESAIARSLSANLGQLPDVGKELAGELGTAEEIEAYLGSFVYRLGRNEEEGIARFRELLHGADLR